MKKFLLISIALLILASCSWFSKYPGYKRTLSGIHYKLITVGEDTRKPEENDYITIDIVYKTLSDSVFFKGRKKFGLTKPDYFGSIDECFSMLSTAEKAEFIINADKFFSKTLHTKIPSFIKSGSDLKIEITMLEIQTEKAYQKEKEAFIKWTENFGDYEKVILKQYIEEQQLNLSPVAEGLYYLCLKPGNNKRVKQGDTVVIDYEGKFQNGKFFDSTVKRHEPFQFVYGTEWQVVKGLEEAVGMMTEGEKALFIMRSDIAFGAEGSSTGIIPPYTSLIFEVELKKIN